MCAGGKTFEWHFDNAKNCHNSASALTAFLKIKKLLSLAVKSSHVVPNNHMCLGTDISFIGVVAVLQQKVADQWRLIAFFSKKLTLTDTRYSKFGLELLAAYLAARYFRYLLEVPTFYILTDKKPLLVHVGFCKSANTGLSTEERCLWVCPKLFSNAQQVLFVLFGWFMRSEVSGCTSDILLSTTCRICSRQHAESFVKLPSSIFWKNFVKVQPYSSTYMATASKIPVLFYQKWDFYVH